MTKTRESSLWMWLARGARRHFGPTLQLERIENAVGSGTPDVRGTLSGRDFWMELKTVAMPARMTTPVKTGLRDVQVEWARDYARAGGKNHYLLIQVGSRSRYLIPGKFIPNLYDTPLPDVRLADLSLLPPGASPDSIILRAASRT